MRELREILREFELRICYLGGKEVEISKVPVIDEIKKWALAFLEGTPHKFTAQSIIEIRRLIREGK